MNRQHAVLLAALGIALCAPAHANPPPWAPAHGQRAKQEREREYHYVYYPAQQVYYAPEQQLWFWMNGGSWQLGVNLPAQYRVGSASGIQVSLSSERPYTQHTYVEQNYGKPWREKHGQGHGNKKHRGDD